MQQTQHTFRIDMNGGRYADMEQKPNGMYVVEIKGAYGRLESACTCSTSNEALKFIEEHDRKLTTNL